MALPYLKCLISPLPLLPGVWYVKTTYRKSWPGNIFQLLTLTFNPCISVKWDHLSTKALYLPYFSYITDPKAEDNSCSSGLVCNTFNKSHLNSFILLVFPHVANFTILTLNV